MEKALKTRQVCFFYLTFLPVIKIFTMPSLLARISNNDLYISALLNFILDLITLIIIINFSKNKGDFYQMAESLLGKNGVKVLAFLYALFFCFKSLLPIFEQKDYIEYTLYMTKSDITYFLPIILLAVYLCMSKLRALGRISDILWGFSVVGLLMLLCLSVSSIDLSTILPFMKTPFFNILLASKNTLIWYGDALYLLFLIGNIKPEKNMNKKIVLLFSLSSLIVIFFIIVFYSSFSSIAYRQRFALTEVSKYSTVINNIGRFDYFAIFFILITTAIAICLPLFFATNLLSFALSLKKGIATVIVCGLVFSTVLIFKEYIFSIEQFSTSIGGYIALFFANVLPIIIVIFSKRRTNEIYKD